MLFGVVLLVAIVTKFAGAAGALMNCRGVTELVVATIALQSQIINTLDFTVLILVALITTAATGPLMQLFAPRRANQDPQNEPSVREPDPQLR